MRRSRLCLALALLMPSAALAAPDSVATNSQPFNPRAGELFDLDPVLKAWAVRIFDRNHDGWLTLYEAQPAAEAFRDIADGDKDGRVTVREYDQALGFIRARF